MRISPNAGEQLTEQEANDGCQNFDNTYSQDPNYLKFIVFGKRFIKGLLSVEGAKGLKLKMALRYNPDTDSEQMYPIPVAVDRQGNELPYPEEVEFDEEQDEEGGLVARGGGDESPLKCPVKCS